MGDMIRSKIIAKVQEAKFFSIMADEVESHSKEKMSLCMRFVDSDANNSLICNFASYQW